MAQKFSIKSSNPNEITFSFENSWLSTINKATWVAFILSGLLLIDFIGFDLMLTKSLNISPLFSIIIFFILILLPELIPAIFYQHLLKEIVIDTKKLKFVYHSKKFDETISLPIKEINLICIANKDEVRIQCLEHQFEVIIDELPLFLDKFSHSTNLQFVETLRLDEKREVLKYRTTQEVNL